MRHSRFSTVLVGGVLVAVGIVIGFVVAADLGWLPFGHAVPDAPVIPVTTVPQPAVSAFSLGGDSNFVQIAKKVRPAVVNRGVNPLLRTLSSVFRRETLLEMFPAPSMMPAFGVPKALERRAVLPTTIRCVNTARPALLHFPL